MLGIGKEAAIFLYAGLTGIVLYFSYQILYWIRKMIPHKAWLVNIEDLIFWLGVSAYLFGQMYRTTYGDIRWFFVLGVIAGCILSWKTVGIVKKIQRNYKSQRKYKKNLEK